MDADDEVDVQKNDGVLVLTVAIATGLATTGGGIIRNPSSFNFNFIHWPSLPPGGSPDEEERISLRTLAKNLDAH